MSMPEEDLIRVRLPLAPEGEVPDLEATIEALAPAHTVMMDTAVLRSGWPEDQVRRAMMVLAISAIIGADGPEAALEVFQAEIEDLRRTSS